MNSDFENKLKQQIISYKSRLLEIKPHLDESDYLNDVYNKLVVKKAIMVKKLKDMQNKRPAWKNLQKVLSFKKREKLICDYFKYPC